MQRSEGDPRSAGRLPAISGRPAKRSFTIGGHRTSISLEAPFWNALKEAAAQDGVPVAKLIAQIDAQRTDCGLSSAIRVWLLTRFRDRAELPDQHKSGARRS